MEKQVIIESCWTDKELGKLKPDFIALANTVFGDFITEHYFRMKFKDNIYGSSLITVAYVDGQPAGTDVLWRNDLDGMTAYQSVDTCVLKRYRGNGLFKMITLHELDVIGPDTFVYGFPNANSFKGYLKQGWRVQYFYKTLSRLRTDTFIESKYAAWWIQSQSGICYTHVRDRYYLIRRKSPTSLATLIGRVDKDTALLFPEATGGWIVKSLDTKPSIYNRNKTIPLVCNQPGMEVPYWKIDAI